MRREKVGCIICAYNEENRIKNVLRVVLSSKSIQEVLVVDDGSLDNTTEVALNCGAGVLVIPKNRGKGAALQKGLQNLKADIYILLDADLLHLKKEHLEALIKPIKNGIDMSVGQTVNNRKRVDLAQKYFSMLNGQRALSKKLVESLPDLSHSRYGVEIVLSNFSDRNGFKTEKVLLAGLSQVLKEEKELGKWKGFLSRLKMYREIIVTIFGIKFS